MIKQVIVMRTDLNIRKGKMIAQGAHASIGALYHLDDNYRDHVMNEWTTQGSTKICVGVNSKEALLLLEKECRETNLNYHLVLDEGRTEFNNVPTYTCLVIGPADADEIDKLTGKLKLL